MTTPTIPGRYRCRNHPHQPVTWKSTGCPDCAADDLERAERRQHRKTILAERTARRADQ